MERDQMTSQFRPHAKDVLVFARDNFLQEQEVGYLRDSFAERFLAWLFGRLSRELTFLKNDNLSHSTEENRIFASFGKTLSFLKEQGIVSHMRRLGDRYNDAPAFSRFTIESAYEAGSMDGNQNMRSYGAGFGRDMSTALSKAIGEFLERYFLTIYHTKDFTKGSCRDMERKDYPIIPLDQFAGFSSEQKKTTPHFSWDLDSSFFWAAAKRISNDKRAFVPAQFIFWNYLFGEEEPRLVNPTTNGSGGMFSVDEAMLSGLYELIQRDAFLIFWLNNITPSKINPRTVPSDDFQKIFEEAERYRFTTHCLNITSNIGVPSFAVVIEDPIQPPRFSLGGGCNADPVKALVRAIEEAWDVYYWLRKERPYSLTESYQPFRTASINRSERLRLWANPEMAEKFAFLISGEEKQFSEANFRFPSSFSSAKEELRSLARHLESFGPGYEAYHYAVHSPILTQLKYFVVKTVVPQLVPLYLNEAFAPLGARRFREVPEKLGYPPAKTWNPWPHPFP